MPLLVVGRGSLTIELCDIELWERGKWVGW